MKLKKIILMALLLTLFTLPVLSSTTVKADNEEPGSTVYVLGVVHVSDIVTQRNFVPMVSFNSDNSVSPVTNRALQSLTPWVSDMQRRATDGGWYFRVSTNEWVNSEYVPSYEFLNQ